MLDWRTTFKPDRELVRLKSAQHLHGTAPVNTLRRKKYE
ncbi:hypothetical protein LC2W_0886 [Lacticaseibacillus paracasei]|nr:hypothetical protein LC2W_0886 [Lacticaseibacillus paracasei]AEA56382.1 hypothetical protein LCBD_0884 [Lacticaseibacillus paracasei]KTE97238.1 hypothetical protein AC564_3142c [Lacticaseibacillus paracasei]